MALVNYDYSSGSDNEITDEEEEASSSKVVPNGLKGNIILNQIGQSQNQLNQNTEINSPENLLFSTLPQSRSVVVQGTEEEDKLEDFIPTVKTLKEKKKVQIPIPSLREFDEPDDEKPSLKRIKPTQKASGLLGILPPVQSVPLSNTSFVPNTVKSKNIPQKTASTSKGLVPDSVKKNLESKKMATLLAKRKRGSGSETDDDDDMPVPDTFDDQMWEKVCGRTKPEKTIKIDNSQSNELEQFTIAPEPEKPYDGLDNRAFKELVGKSKKPMGNIKLIDINEDEIKADQDLWMVKSLTDPDMAPKGGDGSDDVDPTKKRKHHITYLAQQAKANEQELKTAWASSKNNRMMSRSKYGF